MTVDNASTDAEDEYCLCRAGEEGTMIACDNEGGGVKLHAILR